MSQLDNAPVLAAALARLPRELRERAVTELVTITTLERAAAFDDAAEVSRFWNSLDDVRWELDVRAKAERAAAKR